MKIILVEDDDMVRETIVQMLKFLGHVIVDQFSNGNSAIVAIDNSRNQLDLILTDFDLPGANGLQVASSAQKKEIPVVLVTGNPHFTSQTRIPGINRILSKPFELETLRIALSSFKA